ncbi:regulatory protein NPR3 [Neltuma alba]|uniref:regulatory protein NPR3 n=1 Tax=Neltuma alba TaxID=207710 RepID=UPI0010A45411|nr:regulatory protein NPR3-like [Prosopis alba]XP_028751945.1 regulatory protein NPR3-like [Prosopis alba]XP_028779680.1 regulatory protein NPR3-like [Prosopis alba]
MDNANEASSSLSFASSYLSNGSSNPNISSCTSHEQVANPENLSLIKLSGSLEKLLIDTEYDYSDVDIVVEGKHVGVHRCILASRSQFFHELFKKGNDGSVKEGKPKYLMSDLVPYGVVGYEAFLVFLHYLYTGKLKASPPEVSTCVDESCAHDACWPAINYALELMYASSRFQMKELVLLVQRRLLNFVEKALVEDVIPILMAAFYCQLDQLQSHCIQRLARSDLENRTLERELPPEVFSEIKSLRRKVLAESTPDAMEMEPSNERSVTKILKALDSDDIELMTLLLAESSVTLNDAYALHYACAYCDPKIVKEVLNLGSADINHTNPRGYTVLHVAARRKDPTILVALLTEGACVSSVTPDGQTTVGICRRMTRPKDYNEIAERGKESNKDKLCVDLLEREMRRNSMSVNASDTSELTAYDLHVRLDYLENRVAFARLLFPAEAKVAMANAQQESTLDLNETPSMRTRKLQLRLQALLKTVENGRRFFPHCSEVLDKFLDDDMPDIFFLEKGSEQEQRIKKQRFMELKEDVQKAFHKDMAETNGSGFSSVSSSSSSCKKGGLSQRVRKK